jgi:hypothetical protein
LWSSQAVCAELPITFALSWVPPLAATATVNGEADRKHRASTASTILAYCRRFSFKVSRFDFWDPFFIVLSPKKG